MKFFDHFTGQRIEFNFKFGRADRIGPIATPVESPKPTGDDWRFYTPKDLEHPRGPKSKLLKQYDTKVEVAKKPAPITKQLPFELIEKGYVPWSPYENPGQCPVDPKITVQLVIGDRFREYHRIAEAHNFNWDIGTSIVGYRILK